MAKKKKYYSFTQAAALLGLPPKQLTIDLQKGLIKGNQRGQKIKFTDANIQEYEKNTQIDYSVPDVEAYNPSKTKYLGH